MIADSSPRGKGPATPTSTATGYYDRKSKSPQGRVRNTDYSHRLQTFSRTASTDYCATEFFLFLSRVGSSSSGKKKNAHPWYCSEREAASRIARTKDMLDCLTCNVGLPPASVLVIVHATVYPNLPHRFSFASPALVYTSLMMR